MKTKIGLFLLSILNFLYADFVDVSDNYAICSTEYYTTGAAWNIFYSKIGTYTGKQYQDYCPEALLTSGEAGNPDFEFYWNYLDTLYDTLANDQIDTSFTVVSNNIGPQISLDGVSSKHMDHGKNSIPYLLNLNHSGNVEMGYFIRGNILFYSNLQVIAGSFHISSYFKLNNPNTRIASFSGFDYNNDNESDLLLNIRYSDPEFYQSQTTQVTPIHHKKNTVKTLVFDYNNDMKKDLYFVNDGQTNSFYENQGDLNFSQDKACDFGINDPGQGRDAIAADFNNDGYMDIYLVNYGGINRLYINQNGTGFEDKTFEYQVEGQSFCNDVTAGDYDNDGDIDLYIAVGNLDESIPQNNILYTNMNGEYFQKEDNLTTQFSAYSSCANFIDFDADGDLDLFVGNYGKNKLFFNNLNDSTNFVRVIFNGTGNYNYFSYSGVIEVRDNAGKLIRRDEILPENEPTNARIIGGLEANIPYTVYYYHPILSEPMSDTARVGGDVIFYGFD